VRFCDVDFIMREAPILRINGVSAMETVRSPHYRLNNWRRGNNVEIILQRTLSGCGMIRVNGRNLRVGENQMLIASVPERSSYWFDPAQSKDWTFQWLNIGGAIARDLWLPLRRKFGVVVPMDAEGQCARAFALLAADFEANRLQDVRGQAEALYGVFVTCWLEQEGGLDEATGPAVVLKNLIHRRHREPVNIKELCGLVGQTREHLSREFRRIYGIEPAAYLRGLRLDAVETELRHGALSLDTIASRTGFGSGRQLARAFRASRSITPAQFRDMLRRENGGGKTRK